MGSYVETGWNLPEQETFNITLPSDLAKALETVAARARMSKASVVVDALAHAAKFGWTNSAETEPIQSGGVTTDIKLDPKLREEMELRLARFKEEGRNVDLSAVIAALVLFYLREKLREPTAETQPSGG